MAGIEVDPPVGDPGGMRTVAARIGLECEALLSASRGVDSRCEAMVYRCTAGDRFRAEVAGRRRDLELIVEELRDLQRSIVAEAAGLEAAQAAWGRLARLVEHGAAEAARDMTVVESEVRRLVLEL